MAQNLVGGYTEAMAANEEIQKICDEVKRRVQEKTNTMYRVFIAVQYRRQVVSGMTYLISSRFMLEDPVIFI